MNEGGLQSVVTPHMDPELAATQETHGASLAGDSVQLDDGRDFVLDPIEGWLKAIGSEESPLYERITSPRLSGDIEGRVSAWDESLEPADKLRLLDALWAIPTPEDGPHSSRIGMADLAAAAQDPDPAVRRLAVLTATASTNWLPDEVLNRLSVSSDPRMRLALARTMRAMLNAKVLSVDLVTNWLENKLTEPFPTVRNVY